MARVRSKSEEKRVAILDAAENLFTKQGFSATSMDQLAKQAGVSKQTLYSHFGSKDDLFTAAISSKCIAFELNEATLQGSDIRQVLLDFSRRFTQLILSSDAIRIYRICMAEAETYPKLAQLFFQAGPQHVTQLITQYLTQQHEQGVLQVPQPYFAAMQLLQMLQGGQRMRIELGLERMDEQEFEAYLASSVDTFLRAYAVR